MKYLNISILSFLNTGFYLIGLIGSEQNNKLLVLVIYICNSNENVIAYQKMKVKHQKNNLMNKKLRNIASLLLLLVFLLPSIVKLEHHHKHYVYKTKNENNSQVISGKCGICDFEFYVFLSDFGNIELQCEKPLINYCNNYYCIYYSNLSRFSYLLRAPPGLQI